MNSNFLLENVPKLWPIVLGILAIIAFYYNTNSTVKDHEQRLVRVETQIENIDANLVGMQNSLIEIKTTLDIYLKRTQ